MFPIVLLIATLAAPGDVVYVREGNTFVLNGAQKLELASAVASCGFDGVKPASLDKFRCWANVPQPENRRALDLDAMKAGIIWSCRAVDASPTVTDEQVIEMELALTDQDEERTGVCNIVDRGDSAFLVCARPQMDGDGETLVGAFTQSVFGTALLRMYSFVCERNPELATEITCQPHTLAIKSVALWRAARKAELKRVKKTIGRIAK